MSTTPGPWTYEERTLAKSPLWRTLQAFHVSAEATVNCAIAYVPCDVNRDTQEANARLIAAAPDLLAALKDYIEWGAMTGSDRDLFDEKFRAAIAKAEGQS